MLDRGLLLGDGLFETMRVLRGRILQWERHWSRLHGGAQTIGLALPWGKVDLHGAVGQILHANGLAEAAVRLTVTRGNSAARGLLPPADTLPTLIIRATPFAPYPERLYRDGMRAIVSRRVRRNEHSTLSRIKSLCYLDNVLARQEAAEQGADEALLLNTQGNVACAATANVFSVREGRLYTPPVAAGALPGTLRALVSEEFAPKLGCGLHVTQLSETALREADEVFLTNALMGVMPVRAIDGQPIAGGNPGPVTRQLRTMYADWLAANA